METDEIAALVLLAVGLTLIFGVLFFGGPL